MADKKPVSEETPAKKAPASDVAEAPSEMVSDQGDGMTGATAPSAPASEPKAEAPVPSEPRRVYRE
jgi:hypothetical protein